MSLLRPPLPRILSYSSAHKCAEFARLISGEMKCGHQHHSFTRYCIRFESFIYFIKFCSSNFEPICIDSWEFETICSIEGVFWRKSKQRDFEWLVGPVNRSGSNISKIAREIWSWDFSLGLFCTYQCPICGWSRPLFEWRTWHIRHIKVRWKWIAARLTVYTCVQKIMPFLAVI